jgi:branched-chain amino acid transport system substrate-binding protein
MNVMPKLHRFVSGALVIALSLAVTPLPAQSADAKSIKIGFLGTMSGPGGAIGQDMLKAFQLALEEHGGKMGGDTVDLVTGDDQAKSERGVEVANQFLQKDNVDIVTGLSFTNVVDSIMGPVTAAGKMLVAPLGGSSLTAGAKCNENFFMVSWNTDTLFEVLGESMKKQNVKKVAFIAQNFQAGLDAIAGFKRGFGGPLVAEILTPFDQSEFSAELSQIRTAMPQALVYFMPGGSGIALNRQFHQAGLSKQIPLYGATIQADTLTFSALGPAADGIHVVGQHATGQSNVRRCL